MSTLDFSLSLDGVLRVRDAITCLSKFSETIGLEAAKNGIILTALNSSKTASASVEFDKDGYLQSYKFLLASSATQLSQFREPRLSCQFYNKALLSVFKARIADARDRDTSIERCDVSVQDEPDKVECRLIVKMICRHGVKKTYKLTYETVDPIRAVFDRHAARNKWKITANVLKAFSEHFGARTEHLDMYFDAGKVLFTSYTEQISNGTEILKHPLHTSITIHRNEFSEFNVEEKVHVGVSVKDFRAIIMHAASLEAEITALYSKPASPLQFSYAQQGMRCNFILMTIGRYGGGSNNPAPTVNHDRRSKPSVSRNATRATNEQRSKPVVQPDNMAPPSQAAPRSFTRDHGSQILRRPELPPPQASVDHGSLFLADNDEDDDQEWGEHNFDDNEDAVRWDAGGEMPDRPSLKRDRVLREPLARTKADADEGVPPTQRLSQVRGLFDS